jgi:hypothetical protein
LCAPAEAAPATAPSPPATVADLLASFESAIDQLDGLITEESWDDVLKQIQGPSLSAVSKPWLGYPSGEALSEFAGGAPVRRGVCGAFGWSS